MKNILLKKALKEIRNETEIIEKIREATNKMRFDDDKTKNDMADSLNEIHRIGGGVRNISELLDGVEELLYNQKVTSH